jgi:hypothetical protein
VKTSNQVRNRNRDARTGVAASFRDQAAPARRWVLKRSPAATALRPSTGKGDIAGAIIMPPIANPVHTMPGLWLLVNPASQAALQQQSILQFANNAIPITTVEMQAGPRG